MVLWVRPTDSLRHLTEQVSQPVRAKQAGAGRPVQADCTVQKQFKVSLFMFYTLILLKCFQIPYDMIWNSAKLKIHSINDTFSTNYTFSANNMSH